MLYDIVTFVLNVSIFSVIINNLQSGIGHVSVLFKETLEIMVYSVLEIVLKKINVFPARIGKCIACK